MDNYTDTHLCLVCQATLVGLENYVIHKRNGCPAAKPASQPVKMDHAHVLNCPHGGSTEQVEGSMDHHLYHGLHGTALMSASTYRSPEVTTTAGSDSVYRHHSQEGGPSRSVAAAHASQTAAFISPDPPAQSSGVVSSVHQASALYLHADSNPHLGLQAAGSSTLSSLMGNHHHQHSSSTTTFPSGGHPHMQVMSRLQSAEHPTQEAHHALEAAAAMGESSKQKLPSIRTFRSSLRLLPAFSRGSHEASTTEQHHPAVPLSHMHYTHSQHQPQHQPPHLQATPSTMHVEAAGLTSREATNNLGLVGSNSSVAYTSSMPALSGLPASAAAAAAAAGAPHPMMTAGTATTSPHTDTLNVEVSDAVATLVSTFSPSSSRVVDPSMVLYDDDDDDDGLPDDKDSTFTDFFSSLELQYRVESDTPARHAKQGAEGGGSGAGEEEPGTTTDGGGGGGGDHHLKSSCPDARLEMDHHKALHIDSIIDELAFSSDSDNLLPSDAENFFDTSYDGGVNNQSESADDPSAGVLLAEPAATVVANGEASSHLRGKWLPGHKSVGTSTCNNSNKWATPGKTVLTPGKLIQSNGQPCEETGKSTGKLQVGLGKGKTMGGKWQLSDGAEQSDHYDTDVSNDEVEEEGEEQEQEQASNKEEETRGKMIHDGRPVSAEKTYHCKACDRTLLNKVSFQRHCSTTSHIKQVRRRQEAGTTASPTDKDDVATADGSGKQEGSESIECTVCQKWYTNRYNLARHLVSSYHQRRALTDDKAALLAAPYQLLLLRQSRFQCHVCQFYCHTSEQLALHLSSSQHAAGVASLTGPLLCVRCRFACRSHEEMVSHVGSTHHAGVIGKSDRPCVLRESRHRVQCRVCSRVFHSATSLKKHTESAHADDKQEAVAGGGDGEGDADQLTNSPTPSYQGQELKSPPICPYCQKKWSSFASMKLHIRRKHTFEKPFRCDECDRSYTDKYALGLHQQSQKHLSRLMQLGDTRPTNAPTPGSVKRRPRGKVTHKCKLCDYVADKYTDLRPHFLQEHLDSVLECSTCGVKFVTEKAHQSHVNSKAHQRTEEEAQRSVSTHTCSACGKKFYNSKKFLLHKLVHRHVVANSERETTTVNQVRVAHTGLGGQHRKFLASIKSVGHNQKVTCPLCQRSITKQQIYTHLRIHDGVSPFGCIYCAQSFACPKSLQRHLGNHLGIRTHICKVCNKKFSRERALTVHMAAAHGGREHSQQLLRCHHCGISVQHKWQLRMHMLNHSKPIHCQHAGCNGRFKTRSAMLTHFRVHTGERPFLCDECGYSASTRQHLTRHRRTHTGERQYQCDYCEYRAMNSTNLRRHMRIHIGTRPYKCPHCSFTCNTHENVRKHVMKTKKHAGLHVYPCRVCNAFGTNLAAVFKQHLAQAHNIENKNIDVLSEYAGLYNKGEDMKTLPEGARAIIPSRAARWESNSTPRQRKTLPAVSAKVDHDYTAPGQAGYKRGRGRGTRKTKR